MRIEQDGPVTTVTLDRVAVKNAVDRDTAQEFSLGSRALDEGLAGARPCSAGAGRHGASR